jgi:CBS domain-containing protein
MIVTQILSQKPIVGVVTVTPDLSVAEVAKLLSEKRIGAVVVSRDGKSVDGILSERDIVRELGRRGVPCLDDRVAAVMTGRVMTCAPGDTAEAVLARMTAGRFRHMPVVVDGVLTGLISIGDVVKARLSEIEIEKHALEDMIKGY